MNIIIFTLVLDAFGNDFQPYFMRHGNHAGVQGFRALVLERVHQEVLVYFYPVKIEMTQIVKR